jgi:predicted dehydrogenase
MRTLRIGFIGVGFWGRYQLCAWGEVPGVEIAAVCDRNAAAAAAGALLARAARSFTDAAEMLASEPLDAVDIAVGPEGHEPLVRLAAQHRIPAICQKPFAPDFDAAVRMVQECERTGTPLFVHENYRWQTPMRRVREILLSGEIGRPFRAHIQFSHGDPALFQNQPYLFTDSHFAMLDMGLHLFDLARFFFGEPSAIYAREQRVNRQFQGEDIVSALLMWELLTCHCELTWRTSGYEVFIEGTNGSVEWRPGMGIRIETDERSRIEPLEPEYYPWADAAYGFAHASIVATNRHLAQAIRGETTAETTGQDNLRSMQLIALALESSATGQLKQVPGVVRSPAAVA